VIFYTVIVMTVLLLSCVGFLSTNDDYLKTNALIPIIHEKEFRNSIFYIK